MRHVVTIWLVIAVVGIVGRDNSAFVIGVVSANIWVAADWLQNKRTGPPV